MVSSKRSHILKQAPGTKGLDKLHNLKAVFPKGIFTAQIRENKQHYRIPHNRITPGTKLHFQQKILKFVPKLSIKSISRVH